MKARSGSDRPDSSREQSRGDRCGPIATFYSYKGGVGRSFALANTGVALAKWGHRVLCIDWDLDAPGLSHYFRPWIGEPRRGLLELVAGFSRNEQPDWRGHLTSVDIPECDNRLHCILAGVQDDTYTDRVQTIDWDHLYEECDFGLHLEQLREEWKSTYDFVLIDSRTGITDMGGICTVQMPDILVFAFTANYQSLEGVINVVERAIAARDKLPFDRAGLFALPIVCRFDSREEYKKAQSWRSVFADKLGPFYRNWADKSVTPQDLIERTTIPYFSYWSFGEEVPVVSERTTNPDLIGYHLETLAALLAHNLGKTGLLVRNRDSYVSAARRSAKATGATAYDVFLSCSHEDREVADALAERLNASGMRTFISDHSPSTDGDSLSSLERHLESSKHMVALIGPKPGSFQMEVISRFAYHTLDERSDRTVVPVLLPGGSMESAPRFLRNIHSLTYDEANVDAIAKSISAVVRGEAIPVLPPTAEMQPVPEALTSASSASRPPSKARFPLRLFLLAALPFALLFFYSVFFGVAAARYASRRNAIDKEIVDQTSLLVRDEGKPAAVENLIGLLRRTIPREPRWNSIASLFRSLFGEGEPYEGGIAEIKEIFQGLKTKLAGLDLSGIDLSDLNMSEAVLTGCDLSGADLTRTDLSRARMDSALLSQADLSEALLVDCDLTSGRLFGADLSRANLAGSRLHGADLVRTVLDSASFDSASCRNADFTGARCESTRFANADLRGASIALEQLRRAATFKGATVDPELARRIWQAGYGKEHIRQAWSTARPDRQSAMSDSVAAGTGASSRRPFKQERGAVLR